MTVETVLNPTKTIFIPYTTPVPVNMLVSFQRYPVGTLVWGRYSKTVWWPAVIIEGPMAGMKAAKDGHTWLMWFGDYKISQV